MFSKSNIVIDLSDDLNAETNANTNTNTNDEQEVIHIVESVKEDENPTSLSLRPRHVKGSLIIVDNFYNNSPDVRNYILTQDSSAKANYPVQRTISYATEDLKNTIQKYVEPFAGKITMFPIPKADLSDAATIYNGAFQYTIARDRSWVHTDKWNNWAGVLFLTPDAPLSAGTGFYRFYDGSTSQADTDFLKNQKTIDTFSQDLTKWEMVDKVGNVFNRLILFNAHNYHMSLDYFGDCKENGRLFQVFFFSTER